MQFSKVESVKSYVRRLLIWLLWYMETAFRILPCLWQKDFPLDSVLSTATHFILTRYKEGDVILTSPKEEDRRNLL